MAPVFCMHPCPGPGMKFRVVVDVASRNVKSFSLQAAMGITMHCGLVGYSKLHASYSV